MPRRKYMRTCAICRRGNIDRRLLGPLIHARTISAHITCVLYSPILPDATSLCPDSDDAIGGVSSRYIRTEGARAKLLVNRLFGISKYFTMRNVVLFSNRFVSRIFFKACNYCKSSGANTGCCFDIGTNSVEKFCPKKFHVDCGINAGVSYTVSKDRGTVAICFDHRDPKER